MPEKKEAITSVVSTYTFRTGKRAVCKQTKGNNPCQSRNQLNRKWNKTQYRIINRSQHCFLEQSMKSVKPKKKIK
jgi:hypothetical protein